MGILISRFRKKNSTFEVLEKLENEIKEIEESKSCAQIKQRKIAKLLYLYSVGICVICGVVMYFLYSSTFKEKLVYLVPLALSPLLLLLVNKIITWYYVKLIEESQSRLIEMKKEKKRILDEVMDKETYKVAKEILDKFSTDLPKPNQPDLRKRNLNSTNKSNMQLIPEIKKNLTPLQQSKHPSMSPINSNSPPVQRSAEPRVRLPAPIFPLERSYIEKIMEYLIGDGPNNRFALICSQCHSHNGMALKEEFEYISFKCCYCFFYNPARKIRPEAPKLDTSQLSQGTNENNSDSDSDSKSLDFTRNIPGSAIGSGEGDKIEKSKITDVESANLNQKNDNGFLSANEVEMVENEQIEKTLGYNELKEQNIEELSDEKKTIMSTD